MLHQQKQGVHRGEWKVRKPQWTGSPVTVESLHFHWSPRGKYTGIQVRACQQHLSTNHELWPVSGRSVCVCVFMHVLWFCFCFFLLYFMRHFTPRQRSKCTLAQSWCSFCDKSTWELNRIIPSRLTVSHINKFFDAVEVNNLWVTECNDLI